ncbi:hypothetical protein CA13_11410 [Planctomycetes bacterium CA13]|uniref:Uncharacterized protein n=1 Tax=Novipirellula herctigrandis TaxID=2527986 RepID=A0A5C5YXI4_9BACT|nr:hypothetical protein CA13_11410 [Planctomycetes bacterium CA13]
MIWTIRAQRLGYHNRFLAANSAIILAVERIHDSSPMALIFGAHPIRPAQNKKLVWYAPKWSTNHRKWWALRKYLLSSGPLFRMSVATAVAVLLIVAAFKFAFPQMVLPNIWPVFLALPTVLGAMVAQTAMLSLFKQRILVTPKKIVISHGQSATHIKPESLTRVTLTAHAENKTRIRFDYVVKAKPKSKTVGFSEECDLFKLAELLPIEIVTRDVRHRLANVKMST